MNISDTILYSGGFSGQNHMLVPPPGGLAPPPTGNPGPAPALINQYVSIARISLFMTLVTFSSRAYNILHNKQHQMSCILHTAFTQTVFLRH